MSKTSAVSPAADPPPVDLELIIGLLRPAFGSADEDPPTFLDALHRVGAVDQVRGGTRGGSPPCAPVAVMSRR